LAGVRGALATNAVMVSTTALRGGFEFVTRFGIGSAPPTAPRALIGLAAPDGMTTVNPSTLANFAGFYRDSGGGNLLLGCRGAAGTAEGFDTGIQLQQDGWYEAAIWNNPGSTKINASLVRFDIPNVMIKLDIGLSNPPAINTFMKPVVQVGLSVASTAFVLDVGQVYLRSEMH
jgi:hypothetical protein